MLGIDAIIPFDEKLLRLRALGLHLVSSGLNRKFLRLS
jgi:hypothetical protein